MNADGADPVYVLVVEDDRIIRESLTEAICEDLNVEAVGAENGRAALDLVDRWRPAVVLCDLMMPLVDGFEVCRRLKGDPATRTIPVVLMSAARERQSAMNGGADDFLAKPFEIDAMLALVRHWLRRSTADA